MSVGKCSNYKLRVDALVQKCALYLRLYLTIEFLLINAIIYIRCFKAKVLTKNVNLLVELISGLVGVTPDS